MFTYRISCIILLAILLSTQLQAQKSEKDKGKFVPRENNFYKKILKGIEDYDEEDKEVRMSFKMDYSNIDNLPISINEFTTAWCNEPISQGNTGTCWCFATTSYYESEIFRITKQKIDLSELYTVYYEYVEKAREYVRTRGSSFFGQGSETNGVTRIMAMYGIVPQSAYSGMQEEQQYHNHSIMFKEMKTYLNFIKDKNIWEEETVLANIKSIMNYYMGEPPTVIEVNGKKMTPLEYLTNVTKLKPADYVDLMSLVEKPYFERCEYKVPDNWWKSEAYYNVPLEDFMKILKKSIKNGYTIAIGGDVSEAGYNSEFDVAMVPTFDIPSEYIDENARQLRFSNGSTTDDHAIHIIGYKEQGKVFWFLVKDSGSGSRNGRNKGYYFYHEDYVKLKIMTFTVHKDMAADILKKFVKR